MTFTLAAFCVAVGFQRSSAPQIPSFPSQWAHITSVTGETHDGASIGLLAAPADGKKFSATSFTIKNPPLDRYLHFTIYMRQKGTGNAKGSINAFAYGNERQLVFQSSKPIVTRDGDWVKAEADVIAPSGSKELAIWVVDMGDAGIDLSQPEVSLGAPHLVALGGCGLLRASAQCVVSGKGGEVRFPVPSPYRDQAPISFEINSTPPQALKNWKLEQRSPNNWICSANVVPPAGSRAILRWQSLVMIRKSPAIELPKVGFGPFPKEALPWTQSTPVVESDDPGIIAKANELKSGCTDIEQYVRKVIDFTCRNQGSGVAFDALDAKTALGCGGSCTSRSNLGAALLRAAGIPARTVPHLPTWAYGEPLYEHWLTEYWHPGVGWIWLETTLGEFEPDPSTIAALSVASIEDELRTGKDGQYGWIMHGAAWMSGIQAFGDLQSAAEGTESDSSWCKPEKKLEVSPALFAAASRAWPNVTDPRYVRSVESAQSESALTALLASRRAAK